MPGLPQTAGYARALTAIGFPGAPPDEIDRRVALRTGRQQVRGRPSPPRLWAVIDEAVLRRPAGGPQEMRGQLTHPPDAAARPHITVQILPLAAGLHPAIGGTFATPARSTDMTSIHNGMPATDPGPGGWHKPWSGTNGGACLDARKLPGGRVALRQSTNPSSPALILEPADIRAFIHGAKTGLADHLLSP